MTRIGIDIRPLQLNAFKKRGIGIHIRNWIEAAQTLDTTFDFLLLFDPQLSKPQLNLLSSQWKLYPFTFSPPESQKITGILHIDSDDEFKYDSLLEAYLLENKIDLFHATNVFMWEAYTGRRLYHTRWVVTMYDLIPLLFPGEYLYPLGERATLSYAQRLGAAVYSQRIQTISQASKTDISKATNVANDKIDVVYGGVSPVFSSIESAEELQRNLEKLKVPKSYVFSVSGTHHTKNLSGLLTAYSLLSSQLKKQYHLVVLLPLSPQEKIRITRKLKALEIQDNVLLMSDVSQRHLVSLYNGASLVVHPTIFEGLGLPILEAMQCGIPVICSNTSSMPEIAGDAALLIDPKNPQDIANNVALVLQTPSLRTKMRIKGFEQAKKFTWQRTAASILDSYTKALAEPLNALHRPFQAKLSDEIQNTDVEHPIRTKPGQTSRSIFSKRLRLAYWSPFNPKPSGISDYSEFLVSELGKYADIDLYVNGYQPSNLPLFDSFPVFNAQMYPHIARHRSYDINIYQAGNNPLHAYMYKQMLSVPGIMTLHDFCLFHFIFAALMSNKSSEFWQEIAYCEGKEAAAKAKRDFYAKKYDDYSLNVNKRLVENSLGVVVHSKLNLQKLRKYKDIPPTRVISMGTMLLEDDGGHFAKHVRRILRLPEKGFIFGIFGNIHPVKRLPSIFSAFTQIRKQHPEAILFIMGTTNPAAADFIRPYQQNPQLARTQGIYLHLSYAPFDQMFMAMQAIDVGLNLRFPTAGETSSTLSFLLGHGKPVIVSDVGTFTEYPDTCCPKVPVNEQEENILFQQMSMLIQDKNYYQQASLTAFDYARNKTWTAVAQKYLIFAEELLRNRK